MGVDENRRRKMLEHVTPQLEAGEQVMAIVPHSQTGPTPYFVLLTYLYLFFIKVYGVVVTDRRVLMVRRTMMLNRIKGVESALPRAQVRVVEWKPGALWSVLKLDVAGMPVRLNVGRVHRRGAEELVAALGSVPGAATA